MPTPIGRGNLAQNSFQNSDPATLTVTTLSNTSGLLCWYIITANTHGSTYKNAASATFDGDAMTLIDERQWYSGSGFWISYTIWGFLNPAVKTAPLSADMDDGWTGWGGSVAYQYDRVKEIPSGDNVITSNSSGTPATITDTFGKSYSLIWTICNTRTSATYSSPDELIATHGSYEGNVPHSSHTLQRATYPGSFTSSFTIAAPTTKTNHWGMSAIILEDSEDADLKLLLHLDGADDATSTVDSAGRHSPITFQGGANLDDDIFKFGASALELTTATSDYLEIADSSDWDLYGSKYDDYCIDFWVKLSDYSGNSGLISHGDNYTNNGWTLYHDVTSSLGLRLNSSDYGTTFHSNDGTGATGVISDSNWHHIALIKVETDIGIYLDGTQCAYADLSALNPLTAFVGYSGTLKIGAFPGLEGYMDGWLDEVRIARHNDFFNAAPNSGQTDTITVPTQPSIMKPQTIIY